MSSGERTAVLLDPFPLWLDAVEGVLGQNDVEVVGRTTDPARALALVEELRPSVLVAEPGTDNLALIREACERVPGLKAIVFSSAIDPAHIDAAFAAGAVAYVFKTACKDDIHVAIRQTFEHSVFVPTPTFAGNGAPAAPVRAAESEAPPPTMRESAPLTKRELEILRLVAEGHSNSQLARILWVTEQTVKFHLSNIYRKLDVANRTEASRWAQLHGLLGASVHLAG